MTDDGKVELRWFAIPNTRKDCGWLPMVTNNGHNEGCDTWRYNGFSKEEAEALAFERAKEARDQYIGDWDISIVFGEANNRAEVEAPQVRYVVRYYDRQLSHKGRGVQAKSFGDRAEAERFAAENKLYSRPCKVEVTK